MPKWLFFPSGGGGFSSLAVGDTGVFHNAGVSYFSITRMTDTKAIICYQGASAYGTAVCLTLNGNQIEFGNPVTFNSASTFTMSITRMDDTHAIVCYANGGNSNHGTACCLSLSGTTITAGTPVVFNAANTFYHAVASMDSTHAVVIYRNAGNSNYGTACCLTLSGSTITAGTPVVFESAGIYYPSITSMDSSHAVAVYMDEGNNSYGTACCLTLSGTTITDGTPVVFSTANTPYTSVISMDSTHAVVAYRDGNNNYYGTACCLSLSGTAITAGTAVVFESAAVSKLAIACLDNTHTVVCYKDEGNSNYGTANILTLEDTTITAGTPVVFNAAANDYNSVVHLANGKSIVCYQDGGNSNYGTAALITAS